MRSYQKIEKKIRSEILDFLKKYSQKEVAKMLGVSRRLVSEVLNEQKNF